MRSEEVVGSWSCRYVFLKFLEKRGIRNTISIISVYIYSLEMIIVNSENTSVTNRRCIRIVRTGETAYVNVIIFDRYGIRRIDPSGIPNLDHCRNRGNA